MPVPDDIASVPSLPIGGGLKAYLFWGGSVLATVGLPLGIKLGLSKFAERGKKTEERLDNLEKHSVTKADFNVKMGDILEAIHAGQKSTETILGMVNQNVSELNGRVNSMQTQINNLYMEKGHESSTS